MNSAKRSGKTGPGRQRDPHFFPSRERRDSIPSTDFGEIVFCPIVLFPYRSHKLSKCIVPSEVFLLSFHVSFARQK